MALGDKAGSAKKTDKEWPQRPHQGNTRGIPRRLLQRLWSSESCCWKARPEEDLHSKW